MLPLLQAHHKCDVAPGLGGLCRGTRCNSFAYRGGGGYKAADRHLASPGGYAFAQVTGAIERGNLTSFFAAHDCLGSRFSDLAEYVGLVILIVHMRQHRGCLVLSSNLNFTIHFRHSRWHINGSFLEHIA